MLLLVFGPREAVTRKILETWIEVLEVDIHVAFWGGGQPQKHVDAAWWL